MSSRAGERNSNTNCEIVSKLDREWSFVTPTGVSLRELLKFSIAHNSIAIGGLFSLRNKSTSICPRESVHRRKLPLETGVHPCNARVHVTFPICFAPYLRVNNTARNYRSPGKRMHLRNFRFPAPPPLPSPPYSRGSASKKDLWEVSITVPSRI